MTLSTDPAGPKIRIIIGVTIASVLAVSLLPTIPQDPSYHLFADKRAFLGVPNFMNVASNFPLLAAGLWGMFLLAGRAIFFLEKKEEVPYLVFFAGVALTGLGSAWYHLDPSNATLFWDRLPMAVAFMALLVAVFSERVNTRTGIILLVPLVIFGAYSVLYWHYSEAQGRGDLRMYSVVQFYPMVVMPLMIVLFPARYGRQGDFIAVLTWYGLAKLCELLDSSFYAFSGLVSGHTLKHLCAAVAVLWLIRMLIRRKPEGALMPPEVT